MKEGLGFGYKTIEELEAADAAKGQATEVKTEEVKTEPVIETGKEKIEPLKSEEVKKEEPIKTSWLDELNTKFKTEYKSPEEFGQVFEKTKKVSEYETKLKGYEDSEKKYQDQISSLIKAQNPLEHFSSPESYVAEQLRRQYPDKSPLILQDVVTRDNKVMDDLDVLIKNAFLTTPNLKGGEQGVRETILSEYQIDPSTPKEEWPISVQNRIMIEANKARREWDELKSKVVVPKVQTAEERETERVNLMTEKQTRLAPLKESFTKFDKFTEEVEPGKIFDFNVPEEYKEESGKMFDQFFLQAGLEPTQENLATMEELQQAILLKRHFKQIYKTIEGDVQTRERAERDLLLNNTNPTNTKTATETEASDSQKFSKEHGLGKLFSKK